VSEAVFSQVVSLIPVALGGSLGLGFMLLTAWRPAIGCGVFVFSIPLTTGLGRGTIVPLLRPYEAILLAVLGGLTLYHLRRRQRYPISAIDLAVGSCAVGIFVIPLLVLLVSGSSALRELDTLRTLLQPGELLLVYLIFSRADLSSRGLHAVLNLTMLASVLVGLLAIAELALPAVRSVADAYYPPPPAPTWDPLYRPLSTLGYYSAVAAFGTINYTLALALATSRHPAFPRAWLNGVMTVNLASLVASLTWAPLLSLPLVTGVVLWHGRRVPRELGATAVVLALAFVLFWPAISDRGERQGVSSAVGQGFVIPQTFAFRVHHWEEFFIPALADHVWFGTGTVLPSEVPELLSSFVDNEYLREGFRAGIAGLTLLSVMLAVVAVAGWRSRASPDPTRRALGATALALPVFFALVGLTGEYLFFSGVTQEFAMVMGLLRVVAPVAAPVVWRSPSPASAPLAGAPA
jgi:hypothetical protein